MKDTEITRPTLLMDEEKCRRNIREMCKKAQKNSVIFRPHFKTHQSLEIGSWFKELGVDRITVSSLKMAEYFSEQWHDITVAFPVNIREIESINSLAERISLNLLVESKEVVEFLKEHLKSSVGFFIKIDVGYHRAGILPEDLEIINAILEMSKNNSLCKFKGFLTHAGQTYQCRRKACVDEVYRDSKSKLLELKRHYIDEYPDLILSIGDTPTCSIVENFSPIDEIRPGNFVFFDLMQYYIGSCKLDQIAVVMECPIVAIHEKRNEIIIYGGGVHFSKERLELDEYGTIYGQVVVNRGTTWWNIIPGMYLKNLSQEHGIVHVPESLIDTFHVGDLIFVLPVHSCLTANLMGKYVTTSGRVVERM